MRKINCVIVIIALGVVLIWGCHPQKQIAGNYTYKTECMGVELDGSQHGTSDAEEYDKNRDEYLKSFGITVLRFPNRKIHTNLGEVIDVIKAEIHRSNAIRPNAGVKAEARRRQNRSGDESFRDV